MMAAQEIIELFCELVVVRLPIIESQRLDFLLGFNDLFVNCTSGIHKDDVDVENG